MSDRPTDPARAARLADLHARLAAGEFAAALAMDSEPTAERAVEEDRDSFRLYAYGAAVDHDPVSDFDGFVEDLWVMVSSDVQVAANKGRSWEVSGTWWAGLDEPPAADESRDEEGPVGPPSSGP